MKTLRYLVIALSIATSVFAQTRTVEGAAKGRIYNEPMKQWVPTEIEVYVDLKGNFYTVVLQRILQPRGMLPKESLPAFIAALEKSKEWANKAKEGEVEITKSLGDFATPEGLILHDIKLNFFSAKKGKQTDVIMLVTDFDNRFKNAEVYIAVEDVDALIGVLKRVQATYKELLEQKKKSDDFK